MIRIMQDALDFISPRVALSALAGGSGGLTLAALRGHHFPARTAGRAAASCAGVATACFGAERAARAALAGLRVADDPNSLRYLSHAAGGLLGGALLGTVYARKPIRGALCFTPIMLGAAFLDEKFTEFRQGRHSQIQRRKEELQAQEQQQ